MRPCARLRILASVLALIAAEAAFDRAFAEQPAPVTAEPPRAPVHTDAAGYPAIPLLSTGTTVVGETIHYPTTGPAHVTAAIVTLAPGAKTIPHKHGVPLFAYILEGELTVDYGEHGKRTYRKGDAFMEAMDVAHFGMNPGAAPVRLIAVYMGAQGAKDLIAAK
jgi:quercetin dioxygenase-like cupin family protein